MFFQLFRRNSGPFATQPGFDHSKSILIRGLVTILVRISDTVLSKALLHKLLLTVTHALAHFGFFFLQKQVVEKEAEFINSPISSVRALSSEGSVNSSALNGIAPSAVKETNDLSVDEKQMWPALTRRRRMSLYLSLTNHNNYNGDVNPTIRNREKL